MRPWLTLSVLAATLLGVPAGCGNNGASTSDPKAPVEVTATAADASTTSQVGTPTEIQAMKTWKITAGHVGEIELGRAFPAGLLTADLEDHYLARFIADGQPMEGFRFEEPPLTVVLAEGPFAALANEGLDGDPPLQTLRGPATEAARNGAIVARVLIHGEGPKTEAGVGVGSTLPDLRAAYPDLRLRPLPPTMELDDTCVGRSDAVPGVSFVFGNCNKANAGEPVKRVDVWPIEE